MTKTYKEHHLLFRLEDYFRNFFYISRAISTQAKVSTEKPTALQEGLKRQKKGNEIKSSNIASKCVNVCIEIRRCSIGVVDLCSWIWCGVKPPPPGEFMPQYLS